MLDDFLIFDPTSLLEGHKSIRTVDRNGFYGWFDCEAANGFPLLVEVNAHLSLSNSGLLVVYLFFVRRCVFFLNKHLYVAIPRRVLNEGIFISDDLFYTVNNR